MRNSMARGVLAAIILLFGSETAVAQSPPSADQIRSLEEKLEALQKQADELRAELERLKGAAPAAQAPAEPDDLTAIEPVAQAPAPPPAEPSILDAQVVENRPAPTSRIFNPDISVIGNVLGHAGDENPLEERDSIAFEEAEISLQAFVDPYAKAAFFIGVGEDGASLEEGYLQFVTLPFDLAARAGKLKAGFGKFNAQHAHTWLWADAPLVSRSFFGEEGLADAGISVSRIFPNRWNLFVEGTAEVYRGKVDEVFDAQEASDLLWVGHLKTYRDLTDSSNVEIGGSFAQGTAGEGVTSRFSGVDLTYRWKPLERSIYRAFIARSELIANDRDDQDEAALGWYAAADYQFARRWSAGLRLDQADRPETPSATDRGGAFTLTFRPSEFSQIRGELRRTNYEGGEDATEALIQIQFGIGAHSAHTF
ncbi:MAG TPA: bZIP transcription factor [Thermoanaerobaculia bacterium]